LVFQYQEFARIACHLHRHESDVTPDAVFLVDHRGAGIQVREIPQDGLRIRGRSSPPAFLAGTRAEQLPFGKDRQPRCVQLQTADVRRDGERQSRRTGGEGRPVRHRGDGGGMRPQHVLQHFAATRRISGDQHAAIEAVEEAGERRERFGGARIDAQLGWIAGRVIADAVVGVQLQVRLEGLQVMLVSGSAALASSCGVRNSSWGARIGRSMSWRRSS